MGTRNTFPPAQEGTQAPHHPAPVETPEQITSERYPRSSRLSRGPDLVRCWDSGTRRRTPHLELAWRLRSRGQPRVAIVVPRFQHTAVARNQLRRRLREILRRGALAGVGAVDLVVRAKRSAYAAPFAVLSAELTAAVPGK